MFSLLVRHHPAVTFFCRRPRRRCRRAKVDLCASYAINYKWEAISKINWPYSSSKFIYRDRVLASSVEFRCLWISALRVCVCVKHVAQKCRWRIGKYVWQKLKNYTLSSQSWDDERANQPTNQRMLCKLLDRMRWLPFSVFFFLFFFYSHSELSFYIPFNVHFHCFYSYCRVKIDELRLIYSLIWKTEWTAGTARISSLIKSELRQRQNRKWMKKT